MITTREVIEQAKLSNSRSSLDFEKLPFYNEIMDSINKEYSNDDIEALEWILTELGRNVKYVTIRNRLLKKYRARVELTKDSRRNNIKVRLYEVSYLLYGDNTHKNIEHSQMYDVFLFEPFYIGNKELIKNIFSKFEILANKYNIENKEECFELIEQYTKCKRTELFNE